MNYKNGTLSIPFYMFILYLLLSVFIGSIQEAIISISFDRPSVCGCWLAETCIWYFAVWLVMRVFSRAVVTLPLISALINQLFPETFVSTLALIVLFTFEVSVTSIWKSTSTRSISREGIGINPINGALTLCGIVVITPSCCIGLLISNSNTRTVLPSSSKAICL